MICSTTRIVVLHDKNHFFCMFVIDVANLGIVVMHHQSLIKGRLLAIIFISISMSFHVVE